jgi:dihydrofolate reductase
MGKVIFDTSMSLDGFMAAADVRPGAGLGDDGERLHEWVFGADPVGRELLDRAVAGLGAVICGRRTYDLSIPYWGDGGPTGEARVPVVVLTHRSLEDAPHGGVYSVAGDAETALEIARELAGEKDVSLMGADTAQQYLRMGAVDEIEIHLVPVLFGAGVPTFGDLGGKHITLERLDVVDGAAAAHLRYRVVKDA